MTSPGSIFISYRRSDSIGETRRICDCLERHFGRDHVFKNVDSIPLGMNFREYLDQEVGCCQVLVVVIGPKWLDDRGQRFDKSTDWVCRQIEFALRRGIPIIPLLVNDARLPKASELSGELQGLLNWQSIRIRHDPDFRQDVSKLIQGIEHLLGVAEIAEESWQQSSESSPISHKRSQPITRIPSRRFIYTLIGVILFVLVVSYWGYQRWFTDSAHNINRIVLKRTTFRLPDDGKRMNNAQVGPFCCTGQIVVVQSEGGDILGYIYFFDWEGQAYNVEGGSIVPDFAVLVSGLADLDAPDSEQIKNQIAFYAKRLKPQSDWIQAGALEYRATMLDFVLEHGPGAEPYFKMGSLKVRVDVQISDRGSVTRNQDTSVQNRFIREKSIIESAGLPEEFWLTFLIISFILVLFPWLSGSDFRLFQIPRFSRKTRETLRIIGALCFVSAILVHIPLPLLRSSERDEENISANVPSYQKGSINLWKIGSPHSGDIPSTDLPSDILEIARTLKIDIEVRSLSAEEFAKTLFAAIETNSEPDIISLDNYGLIEGITTPLGDFVGITSRQEIRDSIIEVTEALKSLNRGWQFLISSSQNYRKARALVSEMFECAPNLSQGINSLSDFELEDIVDIAKSSAFAYLTCDMENISKVSDRDRLGEGCISKKDSFLVNRVEICAIYGNHGLIFIPILSSVSAERTVGNKSLLAVFRNVDGSWRLLTITDDPVSLRLFDGTLQSLAQRLTDQDDITGFEKPEPATLLTADWEFPAPEYGSRFGKFKWRPSPSKGVIAEIIEFEYGPSTRLFAFIGQSMSERELSSGQLWTTRETWRWRVWSILGNGNLSLSDHRSFIY